MRNDPPFYQGILYFTIVLERLRLGGAQALFPSFNEPFSLFVASLNALQTHLPYG